MNAKARSTFPAHLAAILLLSLAALLFRFPYLINPERMNSDHAFLGLQGLRFLSGDWSLFLWKSGYQGAWEPLIAAIFFKLFGVGYSQLQWVPLAGFFGCVFILYFALVRDLGPVRTFLLLLLLAFTTRPYLDLNVLPYRQWSVLFCLLPLLLLRFSSSGVAVFFAAFCPFFALFVDFFAIQFFVPGAIYAYLVLGRTRLHPYVAGFLVGGGFLLWTRLSASTSAPLAFAPGTILRNAPLFFGTGFPVVAGLPYPSSPTGWVVPTSLIEWVTLLVSYVMLIAQLSAGFITWRMQSVPESLKRLSLLGTLITWNSVLGFLGSSMASDVASVRYLQPILYAAPLALSGWASRLRLRSVAVPIVLYSLLIGWGGWAQMTPVVKGLRPVRDPGSWVDNAMKVRQGLMDRGIRSAVADYWISYQLTFLYREHPVVVPVPAYLDRYAPYREQVMNDPVYAEIFSPADPPAAISARKDELSQSNQLQETLTTDGWTVFVVRR